MIVGIDIRGDSVAVVRVDKSGAIVGRAHQDAATPAAAVDAVRAVASDTPKRLGAAVRDPSDPVATDVVAAVAGVVRVTEAPRVVTRGAAIALAEQWRGAARGARHVVGLFVDDCVHAGVVIDGRLFEGAHGLAGAAGWLALNPVEREDYRQVGCLEAEIASTGIVRRLIWRIKAGDSSRALDLAGGELGAITTRHLFTAAQQSDGVAISVLRDTARYIGMAVANAVALLDPEVVVLGGIVGEAPDLLLEPSRAEAARRLPAAAAKTLRVVAATLGDDAPALGAARAAMM